MHPLDLATALAIMLRCSTMRKVGPKEPVNRGMLDEAVQAILEGMDKMVGE